MDYLTRPTLHHFISQLLQGDGYDLLEGPLTPCSTQPVQSHKFSMFHVPSNYNTAINRDLRSVPFLSRMKSHLIFVWLPAYWYFQKVLKTWQFSKTLGYVVEAPAGLGGITSFAIGFCGLLFYSLIIIVFCFYVVFLLYGTKWNQVVFQSNKLNY